VIERIRTATAGYPRQFWILFWGQLINTSGGSMVWPFLTIYLRQKLDLSMATIGTLFTVSAAAGLIASSIAGPLVDRFGRKGVMVLSLAMGSAFFVARAFAGTLGQWMLLMAFSGAFNPLYSVGSSAMVADLVEPERRAGAYALLRMINNLGVAIGPMVGGFVVSQASYATFFIAAVTTGVFALLVALLARETLPAQAATAAREGDGGYWPVLQDMRFLPFCATYIIAGMAYGFLMIFLSVYVKEGFGVPENQYGMIVASNALMVVFFQYAVTRWTERRHPLMMLALGSALYGLGTGSVALGRSFPAFLISMIVLSLGELIVIPTAQVLTANLAPADMRGRYMSVYGLSASLSFGLAAGGLAERQHRARGDLVRRARAGSCSRSDLRGDEQLRAGADECQDEADPMSPVESMKRSLRTAPEATQCPNCLTS
jgi:MFS family permease